MPKTKEELLEVQLFNAKYALLLASQQLNDIYMQTGSTFNDAAVDGIYKNSVTANKYLELARKEFGKSKMNLNRCIYEYRATCEETGFERR